MNIYIVICEIQGDTYFNSWVKPYKDLGQAQQRAEREINNYAVQYRGRVVERSKPYYLMQSDICTVKIRVEKHEV